MAGKSLGGLFRKRVNRNVGIPNRIFFGVVSWCDFIYTKVQVLSTTSILKKNLSVGMDAPCAPLKVVTYYYLGILLILFEIQYSGVQQSDHFAARW